jgi:hypothetical protein
MFAERFITDLRIVEIFGDQVGLRREVGGQYSSKKAKNVSTNSLIEKVVT